MKNGKLSREGIKAAVKLFEAVRLEKKITIREIVAASGVAKETINKFRSAEVVSESVFDAINEGFLIELQKKSVEKVEDFDLRAVYTSAVKHQNLDNPQYLGIRDIPEEQMEEKLREFKINKTAFGMLDVLEMSIYILEKCDGRIVGYTMLNGKWGQIDILNEAVCEHFEKTKNNIGILIGGRRVFQMFPDAAVSLVGNVFSVEEYNYHASELMETVERWVYKLHLDEKLGNIPLL